MPDEQGNYVPCRACGVGMGSPEDEGCLVKTFPLTDGTEVQRIPYGEEADDYGSGEGKPCGDCAVPVGGVHHVGCDVERCGRCGGQLITCDCPYDDED